MLLKALWTLTTLGSAIAMSATPAMASAKGWSSTAIVHPACGMKPAEGCSGETAPRAAVNARGQTLVAWLGQDRRIQVSSTGANGRFGREATIGKGLRPSVAISAAGTQLVAWSSGTQLQFARRLRGRGRWRTFRLAASGDGAHDDSPRLVAQPAGSTLVVFESTLSNPRTTRLRTVVVSAHGTLGKIRDLGEGSVHRDGLRAATDGHVAVCCLAGPPPATPLPPWLPRPETHVASFVPQVGWSILEPPLGPSDVVQTVAPAGGAVAFGTIGVARRGEGDTVFGIPGVQRMAAGGAYEPPHAAGVTDARRAFGSVVAIDGAGRSVLVYQEKDHPAPFSRQAPVYAVTAPSGERFAERQRLDGGAARQPSLIAYGTGAVAAWQVPGLRWRVSVERGGVFRRAPVPDGPGPSLVSQDFYVNRDMVTNGRYVVLCWTALDGSIRAAVGIL
jgi:hypothetical protein